MSSAANKILIFAGLAILHWQPPPTTRWAPVNAILERKLIM